MSERNAVPSLSILCVLLAHLSWGCGSSASEPGPVATPGDPPQPGDGVMRIELTPGEVAPGTEVTLCEYLEPLAEDVLVTRYETYQDAGGHHLALYKWLGEPKPAGLVEDCSSGDSMIQMMLALTAVAKPKDAAAYVQFPEGNALLVPRGTQLLAQYHYINTTAHTLSYRDVAHLTLAKPEAVQRIIHTYALGSTDFVIAPQGSTTEAFACDIPFEMTPILVLPHMHEHGTAFLSDLLSAGSAQSIIEVDKWEAGMRDMPPLRDFLADTEPTVYEPGDQIRVFCTWDNPGSQEVRFPAEMCASVGYFWTDAAGADDYLCPGNNKIPGR